MANNATSPSSLRKRTAPTEGTCVVWPKGAERRLGVSAMTRWRWERDRKLPARDVHIGGRSGWRVETFEKALSAGGAT